MRRSALPVHRRTIVRPPRPREPLTALAAFALLPLLLGAVGALAARGDGPDAAPGASTVAHDAR